MSIDDWWNRFDADRDAYVEQHGTERGSDEARAWRSEYMEANPFPYASVADVADHIEAHTICALGDAAAWPVQSFVKRFRDEFESYIEKHHA